MKLLERSRYGDLEGVKTLIQQGICVCTSKCSCKQTALHVACEYGHSKVAKYLLDNGTSVNLGAKPLIAAVRYNHYDCVKLLLEYHADANCTNTLQEPAMSVALQRHHYSIILLLLQYDALPLASLSNISVQLLKHAEMQHAKVIQKLIDEKIINLTSESTFMAAFDFAFKHGSFEVAQRVILNDSFQKLKNFILKLHITVQRITGLIFCQNC